MIVDVHCHYVLSSRRAVGGRRFSFEPALGADGGATLDSCIAPRAARRWSWGILRRLLGIDPRLPPGEELDAKLERVFAAQLGLEAPRRVAPGSPTATPQRSAAVDPGADLPIGEPIDRYVLLAFDWYHDRDGRIPPLPQRRGDRGSDMYTSNSLIAELCRQHPERLLLGASVHPYRQDAPACIDEVCAGGASLLKWLPLHQNIDVTDPRSVAVLERCAAQGLPLLAHYGPEFTLATQHPEFVSVAPLLDVLRDLRRRERMPKVIVAHVATPVGPWGDHGSHRLLIDALLGEFADAPLYADISALTAPFKVRYLRQLARRQELHNKLIFGSDFPIPVALWRLGGDLGAARRRIAAEPSWPMRALHVCRHLGFNEIVFTRAGELLRCTGGPAR